MMPKTIRSWMYLALAVVAVAALPALAKETYEFTQAGLQLDLPDGWKAEIDGDLLTMSTKDEDIAITAWSVQNKEFDAAADALGTELEKVVKSCKVEGDPKPMEINGLKAVGLEGTGKIKGVDIKWLVLMVKAKTPVFFLAFAVPESLDKHSDQVMGIFQSIRPKG